MFGKEESIGQCSTTPGGCMRRDVIKVFLPSRSQIAFNLVCQISDLEVLGLIDTNEML